MKLKAAILIPLLIIQGCSLPTNTGTTLDQKQRESVIGKATTDVVDSTFSKPTPTKIEIPSGKDGPVKIEIPETRQEGKRASISAGESSDSSASGSASSYKSVPFLLSVGAGMIAVAIGIWLLFKVLSGSKALKAAWNVSDEYMGHMIAPAQTAAASESDPDKRSMLNSLVSAMQAKRAEFNKD